MKVEEIYAITPDKNGWRVLPNGDRVKLGDWVKLGNDVTLSDGVTLGNEVKLGNGVTSKNLNHQMIESWKALGEFHLLTKWVTRGRMSPNFDGGTPLHYSSGAIIESKGIVSDQQCAKGLHVLRFRHRPEWYGLCEANHDLIPLTVRVRSEDFLFGGLPTMDGKLRVKKLEVLD